ncbi:MAG: OmpA family protein [Epsilonproteobacteria bacterium]|nr:OmpA family protein [Campylobacterota bacterium]
MYKYLLLLFILLFTGCQTQKELHVKQKISNTKPVVLFLLDTSNSFHKNDVKILKNVLINSFQKIDSSKINLGIITSTSKCNQAKLVINPFTSNKIELKKVLSPLNTQGYSNISALLLEAKKILNYVKQPIHIILISSYNKLCNHSPLSLTKTLMKYHQRLTIDTIDYKTGYSYFSILKKIAKIGQGHYFVVTNKTNLKNTLHTLIDNINKKLHLQKQNNTIKALYTVHFQYRSTKLLPEDQKKLQKVANYLQTHYYSVEIQGHTDSKGSEKYNQKISLKRAQEVAKKLIDLGVDKKTIKKVTGYGESRPIATNKTDEGRRKNRRVEIYLLK